MNARQLLDLLRINRQLIVQRNEQAQEHLQMLKKDYAPVLNDETSLGIELSNSLIELYFNSNYISAIDNSVAAVDKYKDTKCRHAIARHFKIIGHCYAHLGDFDLAEMYLLDALDNVAETDEDYIDDKTGILHTLAMSHEFKDDKSTKPIEYLNQAIELLNDEKYAITKANCLMGLGNIYNNIDSMDEALKNYRLAADTFERRYALLNMASAYSNIGSCYIKLEDFDEAEKYLQKSLDLRIKFGSPDELSISYFNLAILFKARKQFVLAEDYLFKAQTIVDELGNRPFLAQVNEEIDDLARAKNAANS